jgi:hypothetical protein
MTSPRRTKQRDEQSPMCEVARLGMEFARLWREDIAIDVLSDNHQDPGDKALCEIRRESNAKQRYFIERQISHGKAKP